MARLPWIWRQSASHRGGAGENGKTFYEESISVSIMLDAEKEHQENFHFHRQLLCRFFCHPPRHRHQTRVERALNMHAQNLFIATGTGKKWTREGTIRSPRVQSFDAATCARQMFTNARLLNARCERSRLLVGRQKEEEEEVMIRPHNDDNNNNNYIFIFPKRG